MKPLAWVSVVIGVFMFVQWGFFIASGQVPELESEPIRIAFHLAAEAATAVALIAAGTALLRHSRHGVALGLAAHGMLAYTVIVSPGYFAQRGEWAPVAMFAALLVIAVGSIVTLTRARVRG